MNWQPQQAVAFFTHLFDPFIERRYKKLKTEIGNHAEIFILAPTGTPIRPEYLDETYFFDYNKLRSGAKVIGDHLIPGNEHLVTLDFYRNYPKFDFYWFIEYDVVFTGNWNFLMNAVRGDPADLLAGHIRSYSDEPDWPWWKALNLPNCPLPRSDWLRAFFPIHRISRAGFQVVDDYLKNGWSGHWEGLIPCAIRSAALSISDIGGSGSWTPRDRLNRFYSSSSSHTGEFLNAGTLRHRPSHYFPSLRRNAIFHPVKQDSIFGSKKWFLRILRRATRLMV